MNSNYSIEDIDILLKKEGYITDDAISTSVYLSMMLQKPLLVEGPAGVGKTEIAKVISRALNTGLIRLQCYEGLDANQALYEWNYQRQLIYLKIHEQSQHNAEEKERAIFSRDFLLERPLLQSISHENSQVLLIDEIDRADEEFESFFLELLSDWQISIPEIGTITATSIPHVIVTSNRVRELSEALRRRCLYLWIDHPSFEKEVSIVLTKLPDIQESLAKEICLFMKEVRKMKLEKLPGIAETLDWATALNAMHIAHLNPSIVESTLGVILKDWQDVRETKTSLSELLDKVGVISKVS